MGSNEQVKRPKRPTLNLEFVEVERQEKRQQEEEKERKAEKKRREEEKRERKRLKEIASICFGAWSP